MKHLLILLTILISVAGSGQMAAENRITGSRLKNVVAARPAALGAGLHADSTRNKLRPADFVPLTSLP